jgi:hypothetical protein
MPDNVLRFATHTAFGFGLVFYLQILGYLIRFERKKEFAINISSLFARVACSWLLGGHS